MAGSAAAAAAASAGTNALDMLASTATDHAFQRIRPLPAPVRSPQMSASTLSPGVDPNEIMLLGKDALAVIRGLDQLRNLVAAAAADDTLRLARNRITNAIKSHRKSVGQYARAQWPGVAQVPYEWQVGRLMRHALDTDNVEGLLLFGAAIDTTGNHHPASAEQLLVIQCLQMSLHPDTDEAVALLYRVVCTDAVARFMPSWNDRMRTMLLVSHLYHKHDADVQRNTHLGRIVYREGIAKITRCLGAGSPFLGNFATVLGLVRDTSDWPFVSVIVLHFLQYEATPRTPGVDHPSTYATARALRHAVRQSTTAPDADDRARLLEPLQRFIDVHWPAGTASATSAANALVQSHAIAALADYLARSRVGDARVIPSIMDYVRAPLASSADRERESQAAHAAFGSAQLVHAQATIAAATPTPTPTLAHSSSGAVAPLRRARDEDDETREDEEAGRNEAMRDRIRVVQTAAAAAAAAPMGAPMPVFRQSPWYQ